MVLDAYFIRKKKNNTSCTYIDYVAYSTIIIKINIHLDVFMTFLINFVPLMSLVLYISDPCGAHTDH